MSIINVLGGLRQNCYKFISMVTGCSPSTVCKVNDQMKETGGEREPPMHGLRKYWLTCTLKGKMAPMDGSLCTVYYFFTTSINV